MIQLSESFGYVLYVDEAGDEGLKSLRPENPQGSSEWMVLAGYLVRAERDLVLPIHLNELRSHIDDATQGRVLHYRKLSPSKRLAATRFLAGIEARAFAVCSFKRTMLGHRNERAAAASGGPISTFYNFLVRLLLERVTEFCRVDTVENQGGEIRPIKVVFFPQGWPPIWSVEGLP